MTKTQHPKAHLTRRASGKVALEIAGHVAGEYDGPGRAIYMARIHGAAVTTWANFGDGAF